MSATLILLFNLESIRVVGQESFSGQGRHGDEHVGEGERKPADQFGADPELHREIVGYDQVQTTGQKESESPAEIQFCPDLVDQGELFAEQMLNEITLADEMAPDQRPAQCLGDDGWRPRKEELVAEEQREPTENHAHPEGELQFATQGLLQEHVNTGLGGDRDHECAVA